MGDTLPPGDLSNLFCVNPSHLTITSINLNLAMVIHPAQKYPFCKSWDILMDMIRQ